MHACCCLLLSLSLSLSLCVCVCVCLSVCLSLGLVVSLADGHVLTDESRSPHTQVLPGMRCKACGTLNPTWLAWNDAKRRTRRLPGSCTSLELAPARGQYLGTAPPRLVLEDEGVESSESTGCAALKVSLSQHLGVAPPQLVFVDIDV